MCTLRLPYPVCVLALDVKQRETALQLSPSKTLSSHLKRNETNVRVVTDLKAHTIHSFTAAIRTTPIGRIFHSPSTLLRKSGILGGCKRSSTSALETRNGSKISNLTNMCKTSLHFALLQV